MIRINLLGSPKPKGKKSAGPALSMPSFELGNWAGPLAQVAVVLLIDHPRASPAGSYVCPSTDHRMEGPVQDPLRDRGNELGIEAGSRNRQASAAPGSKSMLCGGMQADRLQHKEMGQGHEGPGKAVGTPQWFFLPSPDALPVRPDRGHLVRGTDLHCGDDLIVSETALTSQESNAMGVPLTLPYLRNVLRLVRVS